jgi:hypothetical protein
MDDRGDHRMVVVGKERRVLMHRERGALLRWLDEHLRVVKLDVGADDVGGDGCKPLVDDQPRERRALKLDVVAVLQHRLFAL